MTHAVFCSTALDTEVKALLKKPAYNLVLPNLGLRLPCHFISR
jgi:hypothetical protein